MRFAFGAVAGADAKFEIVKDVLECPDPWRLGIVFLVLRPGSRRHAERVRRRLKADPVMRLAMGKYIARLRTAPVQAEKPPEKPVGPAAEPPVIDVGAQPATPPETPRPDPWLAALDDAINEATETGKYDWLEFLSAERQVESVVDMLDGWSGLQRTEGENGSGALVTVDFTAEVATELLTSEEYVVREGLPYAGLTVGAALVQHLTAFAKGHAEARAKYLEGAAKNSEPSSAGA